MPSTSSSGRSASAEGGPSAEAVKRAKKTLVDQLLVIENQRERVDLSIQRLDDNGLASETLTHERDCLRATADTLMLLMEYEKPFVAMVRADRDKREASRSRRSSRAPTGS